MHTSCLTQTVNLTKEMARWFSVRKKLVVQANQLGDNWGVHIQLMTNFSCTTDQCTALSDWNAILGRHGGWGFLCHRWSLRGPNAVTMHQQDSHFHVTQKCIISMSPAPTGGARRFRPPCCPSVAFQSLSTVQTLLCSVASVLIIDWTMFSWAASTFVGM